LRGKKKPAESAKIKRAGGFVNISTHICFPSPRRGDRGRGSLETTAADHRFPFRRVVSCARFAASRGRQSRPRDTAGMPKISRIDFRPAPAVSGEGARGGTLIGDVADPNGSRPPDVSGTSVGVHARIPVSTFTQRINRRVFDRRRRRRSV